MSQSCTALRLTRRIWRMNLNYACVALQALLSVENIIDSAAIYDIPVELLQTSSITKYSVMKHSVVK